MNPLPHLQVTDLKIFFQTERGLVKAVDGVSFSLSAGETLGIVGESGCGKSVTVLSILRLLPHPEGKIAAGKIYYNSPEGTRIDITAQEPNGREMRCLRGNEIAIIFQEPMTSLNPLHTIGRQITESIRLHKHIGSKDSRQLAIEMLRRVELPNPERLVDEYPHQMSGGMCQRAMISMALACGPRLLIADEPTTALDVTIEAQILSLIRDIQDEYGMSLLFITHDLGVIGEMADSVMVMYLGKVVEKATTREIFREPAHPYTKGLLGARPRIGKRQKLVSIDGTIPDLFDRPKGCGFVNRCPQAKKLCREKSPPLSEIESNHFVTCWIYGEHGSVS
jgi:peptide/nickel transport system ATP-binding protein|tara:strand:- start:245 stop:1252 length:1008 start_codon:yes stop_codon:yes gene_type:complete